MKQFSFNLDRILRYRIHLEKKAQGDLFHAKSEYMKRKTAVKRLIEKRMEIAKKCSNEGFKGMDVPLYQIYKSFLQKLHQDLERAYTNLKESEEKLKAQTLFLKKESIKKKTLETLKDFQLQKYITKLKRDEQKDMDELAISKYIGNS